MRRGRCAAVGGLGLFAVACCALLPALAASLGALGVVAAVGAGGAVLAGVGALGMALIGARRARRRSECRAGSVRCRSMTRVDLLYFDGCPGHERLTPVVRRLARAAGAELVLRRVDTQEAAQAERFLGSPTVRVDGRDVDPGAAAREDFGIKCRLYRTRAGALSPLPPERWIRDALEAARG